MKYLGQTLAIIGDKKIVVLPRVFKHKTLGTCYLVKEFSVQTEDYSNYAYADLYPMDDAGNSRMLETYITNILPMKKHEYESNLVFEEKRRKQEAEDIERHRIHGFTDDMTPIQKGRISKCLSRQYRYRADGCIKGGIMTRAEWIEALYKVGSSSTKEKNSEGKNTYWINLPDHKGGYDVTKTEYDYFNFLASIKSKSF